jgi:DNA-binding Xre family transcriptional regulator
MMKLTVKEVALAKGIKNATQLGESTGIPLASIYRIWNGTARMIGLDTLNKLCNFLEVPVGMLLAHIPDKEFSPQPTSPQEVQKLTRRTAVSAKSKREAHKNRSARADQR